MKIFDKQILRLGLQSWRGLTLLTKILFES